MNKIYTLTDFAPFGFPITTNRVKPIQKIIKAYDDNGVEKFIVNYRMAIYMDAGLQYQYSIRDYDVQGFETEPTDEMIVAKIKIEFENMATLTEVV